MRILRTRWKKVIRDLWGNKSRTALVVMAIAVGVFAIGVVSGSRETLTRVLNESFMSTNPANGVLTTLDRFDDAMVETVNNMREVETAEGRTEVHPRYKVNPEDDWQPLTILVADNFEESEIAKISGETGAWPPPDKTLVIERSSLDYLGADIGDTLIVETSAKKERKMKIVGTAHDLSGMSAAISNEPTGFISRDTLEWLGESRDFNRLLYVVAQNKMDKTHIEAVGNLIEKKFNNENLTVLFSDVSNPGEHPANAVLEPLVLILTALGGLALILSGFLVVNTISALLAQQTRQIGMMKIVGGRRGQIMGLYFVMVFVYGLLALLIALPLGGLGAYVLTTYLLNFFNTDLDHFSYPLSVLAIQVAIGLVTPLLAAIYPIMAGTRITVREAVSDYGVGKGKFGASWLDRLLGYFKGISRPMLISLRNTFRRKGRLTLTLVTLTLAGTTFITIFDTRDSMLATLDDQFAAFGFDVLIAFDRDYRTVELDRITAQMPNIATLETWGQANVNLVYANDETGDDITMEAPPANTQMYKPKVVEGRWLQPDDTNALVVDTNLMGDEPYLQVGDTVVLELDNKDTTWQIVGIVQGSIIGSTVYANRPYFDRLTDNVNKARVARIKESDQFTADPDQANKIFEDQFTKAGFEVYRVVTIAEIQAVLNNTFNFLVGFLLAMAVVMAAVGGLGLSSTMSMNVLERVREIGVMRAIGASDGAVLRLVLVEGILIGLLSWIAGAVVALPLSLVISNVLGNSLLDQPLTYAYSFMGLWLWLVIAIILAAIASFFPARNASQLTVREVLAYE